MHGLTTVSCCQAEHEAERQRRTLEQVRREAASEQEAAVAKAVEALMVEHAKLSPLQPCHLAVLFLISSGAVSLAHPWAGDVDSERSCACKRGAIANLAAAAADARRF